MISGCSSFAALVEICSSMVRLDTSRVRPATSMFLDVVDEVLLVLGTLVSKPCVARESRSSANASMDDSTDMAPPPEEIELRDPFVP